MEAVTLAVFSAADAGVVVAIVGVIGSVSAAWLSRKGNKDIEALKQENARDHATVRTELVAVQANQASMLEFLAEHVGNHNVHVGQETRPPLALVESK